MEQKMNPSIGCSVTQCKYNCTGKQHCSLDKVFISDQTRDAKKSRDTLCDSFECKDGSCY